MEFPLNVMTVNIYIYIVYICIYVYIWQYISMQH